MAEPEEQNGDLGQLSIQAASLVRSIDALSRLLWMAIAGAVASVFVAGLSSLETNAGNEFIQFGEYQVPRSIIPPASLVFATFLFWLTASRLRMLDQVLAGNDLPTGTERQLFECNPPVLHVFDVENTRRFAPLCGFSIYLWTWALFFGNSMGLVISSMLHRGPRLNAMDGAMAGLYLLLGIVAMAYGARAIVPVLGRILERLHGRSLAIGVPRLVVVFAVVIAAAVILNPRLLTRTVQEDGLIGPAKANAIDAETIYIKGLEVRQFGIRALSPDARCADRDGQGYPCGREAVAYLQSLLQDADVVCRRFIATGRNRMLGSCRLATGQEHLQGSAEDRFLSPSENRDTLSSRMVRAGWAIGQGSGRKLFGDLQDAAQNERAGIWQGSFDPLERADRPSR